MQRIKRIKQTAVLILCTLCIVFGEWSEYSFFPSKDILAKLYNYNNEIDTTFKPITIINYRYDDETVILNTIEYADLLNSKVIGIDILSSKEFSNSVDTKSPLVYPLNYIGDSIVIGVAFANSKASTSFGNTVSSNMSFIPVIDAGELRVESFSLLTVKYFDNRKYEEISANPNKKWYIKNIPSNKFLNYINDVTNINLEDSEKLIKDKIVLIGFLGSDDYQDADIHSTFMGKKYGVELLAYEIYSLLTLGIKDIIWIWYLPLYSFIIILILLIDRFINKSILYYIALKVFQVILYLSIEFVAISLAKEFGLLLSTNGFRLLIILLPELLFWIKSKKPLSVQSVVPD